MVLAVDAGEKQRAKNVWQGGRGQRRLAVLCEAGNDALLPRTCVPRNKNEPLVQGGYMSPKLDDRIVTLEQRLKQLKAQQQQAAQRRRAFESRQSRKEDTRRKILAGAIVLAKIEQGVLDGAMFQKWMDEALTRPDDRALFKLPT